MFVKFALASLVVVGSSLTIIAAAKLAPHRGDNKADVLTISVRDFCDPTARPTAAERG